VEWALPRPLPIAASCRAALPPSVTPVTRSPKALPAWSTQPQRAWSSRPAALDTSWLPAEQQRSHGGGPLAGATWSSLQATLVAAMWGIFLRHVAKREKVNKPYMVTRFASRPLYSQELSKPATNQCPSSVCILNLNIFGSANCFVCSTIDLVLITIRTVFFSIFSLLVLLNIIYSRIKL
jgi:hypothetical protein